MSRVRKGKKQKKLLAAQPRQPVKPPSRPPPKRKPPASQKGAKKSPSDRDTPQKHSFASSLAVRSKPSKAPPPASPFAGEWSHIQRHIHERPKGDDESVAGTPDSASSDDSEQSERHIEAAAHFSTKGTVLGIEESPRDMSPWGAGILYNGERHRGKRGMKAEQLIEIEDIMRPLRASEIIHSGQQPCDSSGNLKDPMAWDFRLLKNLKGIVRICQDTSTINSLLARYVGLRYARGDHQRHRRVGHGAAMDVWRRLQENQVHEREEIE